VLYWLDVYQYAWYAVIAAGLLYLVAKRMRNARRRRTADRAAD
jgi:hypothetical protein